MKKQLLLLVSLCITALPLSAAMNFYQAENGQIVVEVTDCQSAQRLADLAGLPDDPPTEEQEDSSENSSPAADSPIKQGSQTIVKAVFGKEEAYTSTHERNFNDISDEEMALTEASDFEERQGSFVTYVRDVNWKTGMYLTWRDYSFFRRLKMACSGVNQLSKPFRVNFEAYVGDLDETLENISDKGVDKLAQAARGHSFSAMSRLSLVGLVDIIDRVNPFLLLAIDEDTYNKLVQAEPKIADLFEDMYIFFKIRAIRMKTSYDANTDDLIRVAKIGKGDAFNTWHILSEFAKKMLSLDRASKLTADDEKSIHIWKLESSMNYVKEQVHVERRAADLAVKDPNHKALVKEVKQGPKKRLSLDDKAHELLQKLTQDEIKELIRKYKGK